MRQRSKEAGLSEKAGESSKMTREQIAEYFFLYIRRNFKRQKEAAKHYGVSDGFISAVCRGVKPLTRKMMDELGIIREVKKVEVFSFKVNPEWVNKGSTGNVETGSFEIND